MTDLERVIEEATASKMRLINHKNAHDRLAKVRTELMTLRLLLDPDLIEETNRLVNNGLENLMWHVEAVVREGSDR